MTPEKKTLILRIVFVTLLVISIALSAVGYFLSTSYNDSLESEIVSLKSEIVLLEKAIEDNKILIHTEFSRRVEELFEMRQSDANKANAAIFDLENRIEIIEKDKRGFFSRLINSSPKEEVIPEVTIIVNEAVAEEAEASEENVTPETEVIEAEVIEEVTERPLWKKILQPWKWF